MQTVRLNDNSANSASVNSKHTVHCSKAAAVVRGLCQSYRSQDGTHLKSPGLGCGLFKYPLYRQMYIEV